MCVARLLDRIFEKYELVVVGVNRPVSEGFRCLWLVVNNVLAVFVAGWRNGCGRTSGREILAKRIGIVKIRARRLLCWLPI
jgi:hypothetical protein